MTTPDPSLRVAVITPYFREPLGMLRLCHDSVRTQFHACTHFLIADGEPRREVATWDCQHIVLARSHNDNGNTPRAIGSLSARNQGFAALVYLDADNWLYPNHVETLVALQRQSGAVVCTATRTIHRHDGSLLYLDQNESDGDRHVDTSCLFLTRPTFGLTALWALMPRELGPICDIVFWRAIRARGWTRAHSPRPTVAFRTQYNVHYLLAGETPPPGLKANEDSTGRAWAWWNSLSESTRVEWLGELGIPAL